MSENQSVPPPQGDPTTPAVETTKPRRKRRWWLRILIALPILLIVLVLLAPTLLSLGFVRSMIMPSLQSAIAPNGKVDISSWRFGWFGGQRINGITLYDDRNAAVAHLNVKTDATLWSLIRGNYALGDTTVDGDFDARIDPVTGRVNLLHIMGMESDQPTAPAPSDSKPKPPTKSDAPKPEPTKPADAKPFDFASVKGKLTLNMNGTVSAANGDSKAIPFTKVERANVVLDLNDIERGVGIDGTLRLVVNDKPATLALKGTADAIEKNVIVTDPNQLSADLVATIEQFDLAVVKAALAAADMGDIDVAGLLKGKLVINVQRGGTGSIRSEDALGIDNLLVTAPALKGDTFRSTRVDFPINVSRAAGSDEIKIESLGAKTDVATLAVTGSVSQKAIENLSNSRAPGATSTVQIKADVPNVAAVAAMLPRAIRLQQGVTVNSGALSQTATIDLLADGVKFAESLVVEIAGTSSGKPIALERTTLDANANLALADGQSFETAALMKAIRSIDLDLLAPFAKVTGGGLPEKMQINGNVDLTRFYDDVSQFVDMGKLDLKGKADFSLATSGLPKEGGEAFGARVGFTATGLTVASEAQSLLTNENVKGEIDLLHKTAGDVQTVTFRKLNIGVESGLFGLWTAGENAWIAIRQTTDASGVASTSLVGGDGEFHLRGNVQRLAAPFATSIDPSMQLKRGTLDSVIAFAFDPAKRQYHINSDAKLTKFDVGDILGNETLTLGTKTTAPEDFSSAMTTFDVASSFASLKGDADLLLSRSDKPTLTPLEMARSVNFEGNVPSLPKLYALINSISPPAAVPAPTDGTEPLAPLKIDSGSVAFNGKIARDDAKGITSVVMNVPGVNDLAMTRGPNRFRQAEPITLALAADVSSDPAKATLAEQLKRVLISKLEMKMPGIVQVSMPQAIEVTNLDQPTPSANGTIKAEGNLQPLGEMLAVVNGSNPLPVSGTFATEQKIATSGDNITVVGGAKLDGIRPLGPDAQPLPENLQTVEITSDISTDTKAKSATIRRLELFPPRAKEVLALSAKGTIRELGTNNAFDGLLATVSYDLPQLWPLAQPFIDPTGETIGRVENLAGKYTKQFRIRGSYPTADAAGQPILFNSAVRTVEVDGDLQIDSAELVDQGVGIANLSLPIHLKNGIARIAGADGSLPKDFDVNSGKGKLAGLAVDLSGDEPTLLKLDKHPLVTNATLNPIMSNALGKFFNPIFPNATKARALVTVILSADNLKLGESMKTRDSGNAQVVLSLTEMEISNPLGEQLLGGLLNKASGALNVGGGLDTSDFSNFRGEMRNATFTLSRGVVTQNATFMIGSIDERSDPKAKPKELYPFTFAGDVTLSNLAMNLDAGLPMQLVRNKAKGDTAKVLAYLPDEFRVGFGGTTTTPKIDFRDAGRMFSEALVKFGTSRLTGGDDAGGGSKSPEDILGGLLGGGSKRDDEKKSDEKKAEDEKRTEPAKQEEGERQTKADRRRAEEKRAAEEKAAAEKKAADEKRRAERERSDTPREPKKDSPKKDPAKNDDPPEDQKKKK